MLFRQYSITENSRVRKVKSFCCMTCWLPLKVNAYHGLSLWIDDYKNFTRCYRKINIHSMKFYCSQLSADYILGQIDSIHHFLQYTREFKIKHSVFNETCLVVVTNGDIFGIKHVSFISSDVLLQRLLTVMQTNGQQRWWWMINIYNEQKCIPLKCDAMLKCLLFECLNLMYEFVNIDTQRRQLLC